jgi:outer membrane biosynthesis protein TonB
MNTKLVIAIILVVVGGGALAFFAFDGMKSEDNPTQVNPTPAPTPSPEPVSPQPSESPAPALDPNPAPSVNPTPTPKPPPPPPAVKPNPTPVPPPPPPAPQPTPQPPPTAPQEMQYFTVTADETVATPSSVTVKKGAMVHLTIQVKTEGVYYGGIDYRSSVVNSGTIYAGQTKMITFTADQSFTLVPYWPSSGVQKQSKINIVVQ